MISKSTNKKYKYNGKCYTCSEYARLLSRKTGQNIGLLKNRIRKGWSIEKLMLPDTVKRPVCQYTVGGEFVKKHNSISDAVRTIRKISKSSITQSARRMKTKNGEHRMAGGFIWRYADEIDDTSKKINIIHTEPYNSNKNRYYLRDRYIRMIELCYKPTGKYYEKEKIKVWDEWKNDFEKFYDDLLPLLKKANREYKKYTRRMKRGIKFENSSDELKCNHIWFTRIDKTEGFMPHNICFTTPDWCMRYRPNSHRIIIDNKIKFVPELYDELKVEKNEITEARIRENIVNNEDIFKADHGKNYFYNGQYFTREKICKKFNIPPERATSYLKKFGKKAITKLLEYKEPKTILYKNNKYRFFELAKKLKTERKTKYDIDLLTSRIKALREKKNLFTDKDIENILNTSRQEAVFVNYNGDKILLRELCRKKNFEYSVAWKRFRRGWSIDRMFSPVNKLPFGKEITIIRYKNKDYTIQQIADLTGLTFGSIFWRIKQGWINDRIFIK